MKTNGLQLLPSAFKAQATKCIREHSNKSVDIIRIRHRCFKLLSETRILQHCRNSTFSSTEREKMIKHAVSFSATGNIIVLLLPKMTGLKLSQKSAVS